MFKSASMRSKYQAIIYTSCKLSFSMSRLNRISFQQRSMYKQNMLSRMSMTWFNYQDMHNSGPLNCFLLMRSCLIDIGSALLIFKTSCCLLEVYVTRKLFPFPFASFCLMSMRKQNFHELYLFLGQYVTFGCLFTFFIWL